MSYEPSTLLRRRARRVKAGLAVALLLACIIIVVSLQGLSRFAASGYDDQAGFGAVYDLSRELEGLGRADAAVAAAMPPKIQDAFGRQAEALLMEAWYAALYRGETEADLPRMNDEKKQELLDVLVRQMPEEDRLRYEPARTAVEVLAHGETAQGVPAYEALITRLAAMMPQRQAQLQGELQELNTQIQPQIDDLLRQDKAALFDEGIGTRRITRFADSGRGLLSLVRLLHEQLAALGGDFAGLPEVLLEAAPQDTTVDAALPPQLQSKVILNGLTPEGVNGVKMLAAAKAYVAAMQAQAGQAGQSVDYAPLLDSLLDVSSEEARQELLDKERALRAQHSNDLLAPLYTRTLEEAALAQKGPADERLVALLTAVQEGQPLPQVRDGLMAELMTLRIAHNEGAAAGFGAGLPDDQRLTARLRMLRAMYAVDEGRLSADWQAALAGMDDAQRGALRRELALALAGQTVGEPLAAQINQMPDGERMPALMRMYLAAQSPEGQLLSAQTQSQFRQSLRQNGPRVQAAQAAALGQGSLFAKWVYGNSRTLLLVGVLLALNVLLLMVLMWSQKSWQMNVQWIIILLILDFLLVFQLLPMMHLVVKAFTPNGTFSLDTFKRLYEYQMNWGALTNTIIAALATMALGTLLAFPLAWLVGRTNLYGRQFFRKLFVVTYMVPPYVGAMAWLRLLNPNVGIINQALRAVFNLNTTVGPLNVYSLGGMIWVLTSFYFPYAFITISRAMEKMDPSLEEASRVSGASPLTTVARVTLPMMTPSLIAGALLVFVSAASCYGIPSIIGAPGKVHTVTTRIIEYYGRGTQGLNDATGLAVFLMLMALLILYLSDFVLAKKQYVTVSGKSTRPNIVELRSWRKPLTALVTLVAVIIVLIPFTTILTTSFKIDVGKSVLAAGNFTWGQWETIFSRGETLTSLKNSLIFASIAATVGILIACTMSYLLQRTRIKGRRLPDFLITLGSGTPSVVIALGLIMTMQGGYGVNIYNTAYILIVAYLIKYLLMGMRTVVSAMSQIHVSLEESSTISGAGWLKTMGRITGPLIFPSIAAGWFLIFIPCFYELSMTTLLYSNTTKTIGFQLYEYWTYTSQPQACAMAFGILMVVVLLNLLLNRLTRGEFSI